jgi:hypothetical protein
MRRLAVLYLLYHLLQLQYFLGILRILATYLDNCRTHDILLASILKFQSQAINNLSFSKTYLGLNNIHHSKVTIVNPLSNLYSQQLPLPYRHLNGRPRIFSLHLLSLSCHQ